MKKFLIASVAILSLSAIASAATLGCGVAGAIGSNDFACNGVTFNNFTATEGSTGGGYAIAPGTNIAGNINAVVNVVGGTASITFSLNGNAPANEWNLSASQQSAFDLFFVASSSIGQFVVVGNSQVSSNQPQGSDQITKDVCTALPCTGANYVTSIVTTDLTPNASVGITPLSAIQFHENIQQAASNGTATLTSFTNTMSTPEPMTMGLMGFGLLAVGFFGRRLNLKK
jgi:hypothetical protein